MTTQNKSLRYPVLVTCRAGSLYRRENLRLFYWPDGQGGGDTVIGELKELLKDLLDKKYLDKRLKR